MFRDHFWGCMELTWLLDRCQPQFSIWSHCYSVRSPPLMPFLPPSTAPSPSSTTITVPSHLVILLTTCYNRNSSNTTLLSTYLCASYKAVVSNPDTISYNEVLHDVYTRYGKKLPSLKFMTCTHELWVSRWVHPEQLEQ